MSDLTSAIRQFDATESNIKKLEELWNQIKKLIPSGLSVETGSPDAIRYMELCRRFEHIRASMPKIDSFEIPYCLMDLDEIFQSRLDAHELGEVSLLVSIDREIYKQGEYISEYKFKFGIQRRALVRSALEKAIASVDELLVVLAPSPDSVPSDTVEHPRWKELAGCIAEIDVLRGAAIKAPPRWRDLHRHLAFGMTQDLRDIIRLDWPAAKPKLEEELYGHTDPTPVAVEDLGVLVRTAPAGPVATALKWNEIGDDEFERLMYNLFSQSPGYSNVNWLTKTKAPDRGRDISVDKTITDPLTGMRVSRVIVQCKHWQSKSLAISDIVDLLAQMKLWEPPKVDELIIATTGKFTTDAIDFVERHNLDRKIPTISMWADSHLEALLAERPHLISEFRLR